MEGVKWVAIRHRTATVYTPAGTLPPLHFGGEEIDVDLHRTMNSLGYLLAGSIPLSIAHFYRRNLQPH